MEELGEALADGESEGDALELGLLEELGLMD